MKQILVHPFLKGKKLKSERKRVSGYERTPETNNDTWNVRRAESVSDTKPF